MNTKLQSRQHKATRGAIYTTVALGAIALTVGVCLKATSALRDTPAEARPQVVAQDIGAKPTQADADAAPTDLAQTAAGIRITLSNPRREGDSANFDVCFPSPATGEWLLSGVSLQYDGQLIEDVVGTPIETDATQGQAYRCDTLSFTVPPTAETTSAFTLTIAALRATPREGEECTTYLTTVQSALDASASGIKLGCTQETWGANVTILSYPPSMTEAQAQEIAFSGDQFRIRGPWIFSGNTK